MPNLAVPGFRLPGGASLAYVFVRLFPELTEVSEAWAAVWFALIAGVTIISTIKEELPTGRTSQFWPLFWGATAYTVLL